MDKCRGRLVEEGGRDRLLSPLVARLPSPIMGLRDWY